MAGPRSLSPELAARAVAIARTLVGAARSAALYPASHPTTRGALARLSDAIAEAALDGPLTLGVAPDMLLIDGEPVEPGALSGIVAEAAAYLHDRDLLRVTLTSRPSDAALEALLGLLAEDVNPVRARGGIAIAWLALGHAGIELEAIDYQSILGDPETAAARKDDLWRTLVRLATLRQATLDEAAERRLLEIASDPSAMAEFATDITALKTTPDGTPMITSQAAAVLAAWRHLNGLVAVLAPDRRDAVMKNIASATASLPSPVVVEMLRQNIADERAGDEGALAFDEIQVAQLLATALALGGGTSPRLAEVFDTIAPDEPRKRRILTMARSLLTDTDFGRRPEFDSLWISVEELLLAYNDNEFVSAAYRTSLDTAGERAARMAADRPAQWDAWMASLGEDSVRGLSAQLLIDLLTLETDADAQAALTRDLGALAEDLLMAGDFASARRVVEALRARSSDSARHALDEVGTSAGLADAAALAGDLDAPAFDTFAAIVSVIGPPATEALRRVFLEGPATAQAPIADLIAALGAAAIPRLEPLVTSDNVSARLHGARLIGRIGAAEGVPLLQPLLRGNDPAVAREAVKALSLIDDPAASRAVQTVLRAARGPVRDAVVTALVAERDPRVVPVLTGVLDTSAPAGDDFDVVLDTLKALGILADDRAVASIERTIRTRGWRGRRRLRVVKEAGIETLAAIGSAASRRAITDAAATGDRALRKAARARTVPHG